jgi:hypothetical protein
MHCGLYLFESGINLDDVSGFDEVQAIAEHAASVGGCEAGC